jgi:dienelactone hydrolase
MIARDTFLRPPRAAVLFLVVGPLAVCIGCGSGQEANEGFVPELPPVVEPPPSEPTPADTGLPGSWVPVTELDPVGRMFVVSGGPDAPPTAGLVLVPGRWGVQRELRDLARQLATENLIVAVPDLYDGVVPRMAVSIPELQAGVDEDRALAQIDAALEHCAGADALEEPLELFLFGTGGGAPLAFLHALDTDRALAGIVMDSPAPLPTVPEGLGPLEIPVLVLYGTADASFDPDRLAELEATLDRAGTSAELKGISGAGSELFDERAMGFSSSAMKAALNEMLAFIDARRGG